MGKTLTSVIQEITKANQQQSLELQQATTSTPVNPKRLAGQYALAVPLSRAFNVRSGSPRFSIQTMPALRKRPLVPKEQENAQTYSWSPVTVMESGLTIPVVYGQVKVSGNVMSGHLGSPGGGDDPNAQNLAVLISVGKGPIDSFTGVALNGTQIDYEIGTQFGSPDLAHYDCRYGWLSQPPASNYNDVYTHMPVDSPVSDYPVSYGAPVVFTINMNGYEDLWVYVKFPSGLYNQPTSSSDLAYENCEILVEMRKQGASTWTVISNNDNLASNKRGIFRTYIRVSNEVYGNYFNPLDNATYEIRVTKETVDKTPDIIRALNLQNNTTLPAAENTMVIEYIVAGVRDDFTYNGIAYIELSAVSTSLLNGSCNLDLIVKGRKVRVYSDITNYTLVWSDNPAWICLDVLTQPVWTNSYEWAGTYWFAYNWALAREDGIPVSQIDIQSFINWAAHCNGPVTPPAYDQSDTKRCTFNGIFDSSQGLWDAAQSIAENARAWLIPPSGLSKYRVILDKATSVTQLFNTGNIVAGSLKQTYTSMVDRATEIQADFLNKDNNYTSETLNVVYPTASVSKSESLDLFGITVPSQAWRRSSLFLYYNALTPLEIEFASGQDALNTEAGDVVGIQHELPQWGYGGRVVSASSNSITLDRNVTFAVPASQLMVRTSDDVLYTYTVSTGASPNIVLGTFSPVPQKYDPFTFGSPGLIYKPFRVLKKQDNNEGTFNITAQEYNASIYNIDTGAPPVATPNYSSLNSCPNVTLDKLDEILIKKQDGSIIDCIDVYFTRPNNSVYSKADIYYRSKATVGSSYGDAWAYAGVTLDEKFRIENVLINRYYQVAVVTNNTVGQKATLASSPMGEVYTLGKADPPSNVTNFQANQNINMLTFTWNHIEDADLWGYEIRQGAIYASSTLVIDLQSASRYDWPIPLNGTYRFWLVAIDTSGNKSTTPTNLDVTCTGIEDSLNFLYDVDLIYSGGMSGPTGTKFHYTWTSGTPGSGYLNWSVSGASGSGTPPVWLNQFTTNPDFLAYYESGDIQIAASSVGANIRLAETDDITALNVTDQTFPTRTDQTYPDDTDQHITTITPTYLYFAFSNTTPATGNFTRYTQPSRATFKYIRVREIAVADSYNTLVKVTKLRVCADMDDINIDISVSVVDTGTTVTFATYGLAFFVAPQIQATVSYGSGAASAVSVVPVISNLSKDSCIVKLLDIAGIGRAGTVILNVHGY